MKAIHIAIIGGKLQGVEACYLARKAGWHITLFDRNLACPASQMADQFYPVDVTVTDITALVHGCDALMPALESMAVLDILAQISARTGIPVLCDQQAYALSQSKLDSDAFFAKHGIPVPQYYPQGQFPLVAKPSVGSGSDGVHKVHTLEELTPFLPENTKEEWVIQEYLEGASYSIEVVGNGQQWQPYQVTQIKVDEGYDCNRVEAGHVISPTLRREMEQLGRVLGEKLGICGLFDVETILCRGKMHVLEIDARFPSQTPIAVYHATGVNLLEQLYKAVTHKPLTPYREQGSAYVILSHHLVDTLTGELTSPGEHCMGQFGALTVAKGWHQAHQAILSDTSQPQWVVTTIHTSHRSLAHAEEKLQLTLTQLQTQLAQGRLCYVS